MEEKSPTPSHGTPKGHVFVTLLASVILASSFGFIGGFLAGTDGIRENVLALLPVGMQEQLRADATIPAVGSAPMEDIVVAKTFEEKVVASVESASPAVVSIVAAKDVPILERSYFNPFEGDSFFDQFFGNGMFDFGTPQYEQKGTERRDVGAGTGFFVSDDGYIVTNRHVVLDEEADYTVITIDGTRHDAEVLARDSINDIAVLKIATEGTVPFIPLGDSESIKVGQSVIAIGYALGRFGNSVSLGIVSGLSRSIQAGDGHGDLEDLYDVIQTDAAINPGNSGGPLLDIDGNAIGMNVAVAQGGQNIGFALPIQDIRVVVDSVRETGRIVRPYLGVRYVMITDDLVKANQLPVDHGALVVRGETPTDLAISPGSPADIAGIVENDIILSVDGKDLDIDHPLALAIRKYEVGDVLTLQLSSKGEEKEVTVTLTERK